MRNDVNHFSQNPVDVDIQRSRFNRPFNHKFTGYVGQLIPHYWEEILPGDTVKLSTSKVVRLTTLLDPVMDNLYLDTYYFFVPMRLVWDHTKEFFGENSSGPWAPQVSYTIPQLTYGLSSAAAFESVLDYMGGWSPNVYDTISVSALPVRAYNKVWADWFMAQSVDSPPNLYTGDSTVAFDATDPLKGGQPYDVNKLFDYFVSCLPSPQRGPSVNIPLGGNITVTGSGQSLDVKGAGSTHSMGNTLKFGTTGLTTFNVNVVTDAEASNPGAIFTNSYGQIFPEYGPINRNNLYVTLPEMVGQMSTAAPISVNDLRLAFQIQKWYEKSAMYGGRYIEMLKAQFGVTSPDARLQRSEYLGGNRVPISIHQVENNSAGGSVPLGKLGAYSATSDYNDDFVHSFTEHGFLIGVCCVRYPHTYTSGVSAPWWRKTMFDHYFPVLANIGNQPVYKREIYADGTSDDNDVWGYQEAWASYRYSPDRCSGWMRPGFNNSLGSWSFADTYSNTPTLSASWMKENPWNVDRCLAVSAETAPQLLFDVVIDSTWTRCMPLYSIPGLIDHH